MLNRTILVGRLTRDPELRTTQSGLNVASFTLAVNRTFTNAQGEREADFINVIVFKKQAENVNKYLSKGSLAGVDGRLQTRNYENKEGQRVYVTEVVADSIQFLEPKNINNNQQDLYQQQAQQTRGQSQNPYNKPVKDNPFANANGSIDISDDDLPF
ncbi:TPA: single-stranded DNA-binding protein [Staphylococcus aureus]|uniref:single-stranded DNA-binding protein n=1 Tax=Staphylococcus aureus TaxID=1280 RepID=UPI0011CAD4DE|nr:single-stranded DNA-binding protein [Staphylococcus aureus]MBB2535548.1 single-stranded DNA-binding protein [Staphylococcus aureus]MBB2556773.1 single-stranded DNA-binding protein [Staphylococcus aureus]TXO25082.1 single-stranded DNA-binding protein [Staphylococcus aureus]HCU8275451.1 single-stranded DNA-binding protein [Staphylococcus aureus]